MSLRKFGAILGLIACASFMAVPAVASAQTTPPPIPVQSFKAIPIAGTASNGKAFRGKFSIDHFATEGGKTVAVGTLQGHIGHKLVKKSTVPIPIDPQTSNGSATTAATCQILHLTLGPVDLHLLGLNVHLNEVVLDITATSGNGQLLGNLLCDVANLLNGNTLLPPQVTSLLNILNTLVGNLGVLGL